MVLNERNGCDDLPGGVTPPQASMKLSPPHRSPALPCRGPHLHHHYCSPPRHRCSPVRATGMAGAAGMTGTADSPAPSD